MTPEECIVLALAFDYESGNSISGTSQRIGNTTYHDFYNYGTGESHSGTSQKIGNTVYHDW